MAKDPQDEGKRKDRRIKARLALVELGDEEAPKLSVAIVDPRGRRQALELSDELRFEVDGALLEKGYRLEIRGTDGGEARRFSLDTFAGRMRREGVYRIPQATWRRWILPSTCVSGKVEVCRWIPRIYDPNELVARARVGFVGDMLALARNVVPEIAQRRDALRLKPTVCEPVCNGKVEVFLRTCCCPVVSPIDPPVVIEELCEILGCPPEPWPPEP